jgi:hypothetical protein
MRNNVIVLCVAIMLLFTANISIAQDYIVYKHPTLNIQFKAPSNWKRLPRPEDKNTYEIVDPNRSVHVIVWHTTTEQDGQAYLEKMASMKDLIVSESDIPQKIIIKNEEAFLMTVPGYEGKVPIQTFLAVIPHGKSTKYPSENYLFLIQIWCPKEYYEKNKSVMKEILASMEILTQ